MKKIALALAVLFLSSSLALAAWNIRQKDDGSAEWVKPRGADGAEVTSKIGSVKLTAYMADVTTLSTAVVVSPITDGKISLVQAVMGGASTPNLTFRMYITNLATGNSFGSKVSNGVSDFVLNGASLPGAVATFTPTNNHTIERNRALLIESQGTVGTSGVPVTFTITIDPR